MKSYIFLHYALTAQLFILCVEGFVISPHHHAAGRTVLLKYRSPHERTTSSRASYSLTTAVLYESQDPNQDNETSPPPTNPTTTTDELDYDFESGFQNRLKKEGGRTGLTLKAAQRTAKTTIHTATLKTTKSVKTNLGSVKTNLQLDDLGLLSNSEWSMTLGVLVLVVVLAVGSHFAGPPETFAALGTKEQLERLANAESVGFGVGAGVR